MTQNLNTVALTGNLTRDPELRSLSSGVSVCSLRIAVNESRKVNGEWTEYANYFDITVWGGQGESCAQYLSKGRPVAIQGRLQWREWESDGNKRQAVDVVADRVQFLGSRDDNGHAKTETIGGIDPATQTETISTEEARAAAEAAKASGPGAGSMEATPENIKAACICKPGYPNDNCPIANHGVPF